MLQNKFLFNQSSVSLEIIGLPDYSNNENKDYISIISQWRLLITDKPVIEGNIDHLSTIMRAFYSYSISLLNDEIFINILLTLALCISEEGFLRLRTTLFNF